MACRSCGEQKLLELLDLGETPLANSLLSGDELSSPEEKFPLQLFFCPSCSLVQIGESVPPEKMFSKYRYFSSYSDTMLAHSQKLAERVIADRKLGADSLVIEVASNDGYLLQFYKNRGVGVLGIEPARNVANHAIEVKGIPTLVEFFGAEFAAEYVRRNSRCDVLHANNVFAHVPDINGFAEGIRTILKSDGVAYLESPYLKNLLDNCEFDTIYHELLFYYSLTALDRLFARHGMLIFDAEKIPIHGGSMRIHVCHAGYMARSERATRLLAEELEWGVDSPATYLNFSEKVQNLKKDLCWLLHDLKSQGKRIAAYGAAAKGSTLINYFDLGRELIDFVADRSPHKQGLFMPGKHIPIVAVDVLLEKMPDYVLLFTWNFADEILEQQKEYRRRGGRFIIPIPEPTIL